ncbi:hypothetical protein Tco_0777429 [Tanacetum coccineum]
MLDKRESDIGGSCLNGNQQVNLTGVGMYDISGNAVDVNTNVCSASTVSKRQRVGGHINDVGLSFMGTSLCHTRKHNLDSRLTGNNTETSGTYAGVSIVPATTCNIQVKDNKIDLLVQQYEQFTILEEESIDSGFAKFNTIITSLKALDEGFSSKNYIRKFLRALYPK